MTISIPKNGIAKEYIANDKAPLLSAIFTTRVLWLGASFPMIFSLSACNSELPPDAFKQKQYDVAIIEDNITNFHATLAAQRGDICPKLLQKEVDSDIIERTAEVMINNNCDYFLYPRVGQTMTVYVDEDTTEALLIVPTLHNFANGSYQVKAYDKHVIRLSYNAVAPKPERFEYSVVVHISDEGS